MEIEQLTGVTVKEPLPWCVQFLEDVLNEPITASTTTGTLQKTDEYTGSHVIEPAGAVGTGAAGAGKGAPIISFIEKKKDK